MDILDNGQNVKNLSEIQYPHPDTAAILTLSRSRAPPSSTLPRSSYLSVTAADALSVGAEGSHEVGGGEKSVLVSIHDAESLLELLDGRVGERFEDVGFLRHFE